MKIRLVLVPGSNGNIVTMFAFFSFFEKPYNFYNFEKQNEDREPLGLNSCLQNFITFEVFPEGKGAEMS